MYRQMGQLERAREVLLEALRYREEAAGQGEPELVQELAATLFNLAQVLRDLGELEEAQRSAGQAADLWRGLADSPEAPLHWHQAYVRSLLLLAQLQEGRDDKPGRRGRCGRRFSVRRRWPRRRARPRPR